MSSPRAASGGSSTKGDTVLIAADGSEYSDYAFDFYMQNLHKPENHVILAHSSELKGVSNQVLDVSTGAPNATMVTDEIMKEEARAKELLDHLTLKLEQLSVNAEVSGTHGEAGPAILKLANEKHVDFIVVGCRGKGSVRRTLTGSVTDYVTHHSRVPVVVARHKDHVKHYPGFHLNHLNPFHHKHHGDDHKHHGDKGHDSSHKAPTSPRSPTSH